MDLARLGLASQKAVGPLRVSFQALQLRASPQHTALISSGIAGRAVGIACFREF